MQHPEEEFVVYFGGTPVVAFEQGRPPFKEGSPHRSPRKTPEQSSPAISPMKTPDVCVCVCSGNPVPGGSCNHAIPIATSPPRESPPHLCHPVVLPLQSPWGIFRRGFQRVPVPRSLDSVTRSDVTTWAMSHQVFIAGTACISGKGQHPPTSDVRDTGQLGLLGQS
jgi:hypothetical protein